MAIKGYFFNAIYDSETGSYDREYDANAITEYLSALVGGGVIPNPSTNMQVMAAGVMNIVVNPGQGFWSDGHKMVNESSFPLTVSAADVLQPRIDRVVMYCDYANRVCGLEVKTGTPAADPVPPALVRGTDRYEYGLATIYVGAGASAITQSVITDTRPDNDVCGWVTGLIDQVDTSTLFAQWETAYEEYFTEQQDNFAEWLSHLTQQLNVDTYVENYEKSASFTSADATKVITLDWAGYTYEVSDIINVYINGLLAVSGTDYTLDTTGANPTVTFAFAGSSLTDVCRVQVLKSVIGFDVSP